MRVHSNPVGCQAKGTLLFHARGHHSDASVCMCVNVYMSVCVCAGRFPYQASVYDRTPVDRSRCVCVCVRVCVCVKVYTCVCVCMNMYVSMCLRVNVYMCV